VGHGPFSSALSVPDFAATEAAGLEPVDIVQGFCVMQWTWRQAGLSYTGFPGVSAQPPRGTYSRQWNCPHGYVSAEHRRWGANMEQDALETGWMTGYTTARSRMLEEARQAGAHGVIGVIDSTRWMSELSLLEFHLLGTAVVVRDAPAPDAADPWSTYLAGQRLTKLLEAGWVPIGIVAARSSVYVYASCITEAQLQYASAYSYSGEVEQLSDARMAAVQIARAQVSHQLGRDELHGAAVHVSGGHTGVTCTMSGTRVRRWGPAEPLEPPVPTVTLR